MDAWTIVGNISTGVATGVLTGVAVGFFGVRSALKQFRMQRGFERRLHWYEKTTQAVIEFVHLNETIVFALNNNRIDLLKEAMENTSAPLKEFQKTLNNSLLYSDRELYLRLKEVGAKLREITEATGERLRSGGKPTELYQSNVKLLERTLFELAKPVRNMLGLDVLNLADFEK